MCFVCKYYIYGFIFAHNPEFQGGKKKWLQQLKAVVLDLMQPLPGIGIMQGKTLTLCSNSTFVFFSHLTPTLQTNNDCFFSLYSGLSGRSDHNLNETVGICWKKKQNCIKLQPVQERAARRAFSCERGVKGDIVIADLGGNLTLKQMSLQHCLSSYICLFSVGEETCCSGNSDDSQISPCIIWSSVWFQWLPWSHGKPGVAKLKKLSHYSVQCQ